MRALWRRIELQHHVILTTGLDGCERPTSRHSHFTEGKDFPVSTKQDGWAPEYVWTFWSTERYRGPARYATADLPAHILGSIVKEVVYVHVCTSFPKEGLKHK
jgi:hypothetical protein